MKLFVGRIGELEAVITAPTPGEASEALAEVYKEKVLAHAVTPDKFVVTAELEEVANLENDVPEVKLFDATAKKCEHIRVQMHEHKEEQEHMNFEEFMLGIMDHMIAKEKRKQDTAGCTKCDSTCDKCKEKNPTQDLLDKFIGGSEK